MVGQPKTHISHHVYPYVFFKDLPITLFQIFSKPPRHIEKLEAFKVHVSIMCLQLLHMLDIVAFQVHVSIM